MSIVYVDIEVNQKNIIVDYGAFADESKRYHGNRMEFIGFINGYEYICGHNVLMHDLKYLTKEVEQAGISRVIDTLPLSALLFPKKPYHKLVKDYKMNSNDSNNPYIDSKLAFDLFQEEIYAFKKLDKDLQNIYYGLLNTTNTFKDFFKYIDYKVKNINTLDLIKTSFNNRICSNCKLNELIDKYPIELAYALAIIDVNHQSSIAPPWILYTYKNYNSVMDHLRGYSCKECDFCNEFLDSKKALKKYFSFDEYRLFKGVNLQEQAVKAQVDNESIIVVFPTAGGKSLTFQIPALMFGETVKGLTIVISPLQSLMNDQINNLKAVNINNVGTINGGMNVIDRTQTINRVKSGDINLLYISPEALRTPSMLDLVSRRNVVRIVIDEAHCFSTWGHDFRVDYLYIAEFIKMLTNRSQYNKIIPVSCFTATAKKEVINDISAYFKEKLDLDMKVIVTNTRRDNLKFIVHDCKDKTHKMQTIKDLLNASNDKPVIIYTSRRKSADDIAYDLAQSGFSSTVYHAGIETKKKAENQKQFNEDKKNIIVATSAFGMGVDKSDIAFIIHYNVSSTIEDYIQEAGRGGRDKNILAECHILYNENDIDDHFNMLNQQKLSRNEINQIWRYIKNNSNKSNKISLSCKELIKRVGWVSNSNYGSNLEFKAKNCISALENVGYIKRHQNSPRVFASSIVAKTMVDTSTAIDKITNVTDEVKGHLRRIMSTLYTDKNTRINRGTKPISMIDDLYDLLNFKKYDLIKYVNILRDNKILELENDLTVHVPLNGNENKSARIVVKFINIIKGILDNITSEKEDYNLKEMNTTIKKHVKNCSIKNIRTMINLLDSFKIIHQSKNSKNKHYHNLNLLKNKKEISDFVDNLGSISGFIVKYSYEKKNSSENEFINYSQIDLKRQYMSIESTVKKEASINQIENALLFIHRINALIIDGGILVIYNPMQIEKLQMIPNKQYNSEHYKDFLDFYNRKIRKIHILMLFIKNLRESNEKGLALVDDYFELQYKDFEKKYITSDYKKVMKYPMTATKYQKLLENLSDEQKIVIEDKDSKKNIVVIAGPGSGKTTLLVHKLASLVKLEDVKLTELLMLTFSRSATIVFKEKLRKLIGNSANYIDIKTFHSYCFDLIGQVGDLTNMENLFEKAITEIENKNVEESYINKSTLVIDEAQDMSEKEYLLLQALIKHNVKMRVIAVGDDDQNIYEFRKSDSKYFYKLNDENCNKYELSTNFRSKNNLVNFTQSFTNKLTNRYKNEISKSYTNENGYISIFKYKENSMYIPIVNQIRKVQNTKSLAVLTYTNQDAEILAALLIKEGLRVKLLQGDNTNIRLNYIYEIDYFIKYFDEDEKIITKESWNEKKEKFFLTFENNPLIEDIYELIRGFEILYPKTKYRIDLLTYISESRLDDLYSHKPNIITVSNFHKSKGTEFESVFLMVSDRSFKDEDLRTIYVSMTRAKTNLVIHTNSNIFDDMENDTLIKKEDMKTYDKPKELIIQMTHKHINLSSSSRTSDRVLKVNTGEEINIEDGFCTYNSKKVIYFSKRMKELIISKKNNGYIPFKAIVTYKVKWYDIEADKQYWILLPKLYFRKEDE